MKPLLPMMLIALTFTAAPAFAQDAVPSSAGPEKVNQRIVYGEDPCEQGAADEIVVCVRMPDTERYRIPENLRGDPNAPANLAWAERVKSIEYVGKSGTESCSPVGGGGFTGCFTQIANQARAERKQLDNVSWADLVEAERAKRLAKIDAESDAIEARVKAEEAAASAPVEVSAQNP